MYSLLEFGLVVIVVFFGSRAMRPKPAQKVAESGEEVLGEETLVEDVPAYHTITGEALSPTEQETQPRN